MYTTIVFDLDGTLLDTLDDLTAAVNFALAKNGCAERTREEVRGFVGNGIVKLMERAIGLSAENAPDSIAKNAKGADFSVIFEDFKTYYKENCSVYTKPYEGIMELLSALKNRGLKLALLSNKADYAVKILAKEYFGDLFLEAIGENEAAGIRKKPAPDSLFAVLERLGAEKKTTVYVGDSEVDIQTAKNAGVDCISVTWGFKNKAFLVENGGEIFVDLPMEILNFCKE